MSIGENIKRIREQHDLSQADLAKILDVSEQAVSSWETNARTPRMGVIQKIADKFDILKSNIIEDNGIQDGFWEAKKKDEEMDEIIQAIKDRPEMHTLFSKTSKTSKETVEKTIKMLEILKETNHDL